MFCTPACLKTSEPEVYCSLGFIGNWCWALHKSLLIIGVLLGTTGCLNGLNGADYISHHDLLCQKLLVLTFFIEGILKCCNHCSQCWVHCDCIEGPWPWWRCDFSWSDVWNDFSNSSTLWATSGLAVIYLCKSVGLSVSQMTPPSHLIFLFIY